MPGRSDQYDAQGARDTASTLARETAAGFKLIENRMADMNGTLQRIELQGEHTEEEVQRLNKALFGGNGAISMETRMGIAEERQTQMKNELASVRLHLAQKDAEERARAMKVWLAVASALVTLGMFVLNMLIHAK